MCWCGCILFFVLPGKSKKGGDNVVAMGNKVFDVLYLPPHIRKESEAKHNRKKKMQGTIRCSISFVLCLYRGIDTVQSTVTITPPKKKQYTNNNHQQGNRKIHCVLLCFFLFVSLCLRRVFDGSIVCALANLALDTLDCSTLQ
jgi:hypothetical protein